MFLFQQESKRDSGRRTDSNIAAAKKTAEMFFLITLDHDVKSSRQKKVANK